MCSCGLQFGHKDFGCSGPPTFHPLLPLRRMIAEMARMKMSGFLDRVEFSRLLPYTSATFTAFEDPYGYSSKQPDFGILPRHQGHSTPTFVILSGWPESAQYFHEDAILWIRGGRVNIVLVFRWSKSESSQVVQSETIFPPPANAATQGVTVTRGQLFGSAILGRDSGDSFDLSLANLRKDATDLMRNDGLVPATV